MPFTSTIYSALFDALSMNCLLYKSFIYNSCCCYALNCHMNVHERIYAHVYMLQVAVMTLHMTYGSVHRFLACLHFDTHVVLIFICLLPCFWYICIFIHIMLADVPLITWISYIYIRLTYSMVWKGLLPKVWKVGIALSYI